MTECEHGDHDLTVEMSEASQHMNGVEIEAWVACTDCGAYWTGSGELRRDD